MYSGITRYGINREYCSMVMPLSIPVLNCPFLALLKRSKGDGSQELLFTRQSLLLNSDATKRTYQRIKSNQIGPLSRISFTV
jgi:hypothetical protein